MQSQKPLAYLLNNVAVLLTFKLHVYYFSFKLLMLFNISFKLSVYNDIIVSIYFMEIDHIDE